MRKGGSFDWVIKTGKKKIWKKCLRFLERFSLGCLYTDLPLLNLNLKIAFKNCSLSTFEKQKKRFMLPIASFSYFEYVWVISIFYSELDYWIVDAVWNRVIVSIFFNFKIAYNIGKEIILNLCCVKITFNDFIIFN